MLSAAPDYARGQLIVKIKATIDVTDIEQLAQGQGLTMRSLHRAATARPNKEHIMLLSHPTRSTAQLMAALKHDPTIEYAEPNYIKQLSSLPNDPDFNLLWGLHNTGQAVNGTSGIADADIDYEESLELARYPNPEVVVGVADTGMSILHPDLNANLWINPNEIPENGIDDDANGYIDDEYGYDFGTDTHWMVDNDNHGTHVSGTIAAVSDNAIGISGVHGAARLLPLKIEASDGSLYTSDIIEAFLYAVDLKNSGVNLVAVNASFGGPSYTQAEHDAIDDMNTAGIILCAAAGNDGFNNDTTPSYPANYDLPNIISIAATDQNNNLASFSNYGSSTVDLAAPGVNIYSTLPLNFINYTTSLSSGGSNYTATNLEHAGSTTGSGITGELIDCGLGYPIDFPESVTGNIALIKRGELTFSDKVDHAVAAGVIGALIYNHENSPPGTWTLGREDNWIPALQLTKSIGDDLLATLPASATLINSSDLSTAYQFLNGTSMATPHVTGAVAFAAMNFPNDSVSQRIARILNNVTPVPALSGVVSTGGVLNLQSLVDSDSDAIGDWWEEDHFGDLSNDGSIDSDGDGFTDTAEFLSLTDPTSGSSRFTLDTVGFNLIEGATLQFKSAPSRSYQVLWRASLTQGSWQILQDNIEGDGSIVNVLDTDAANADRRFYQLQLVE